MKVNAEWLGSNVPTTELVTIGETAAWLGLTVATLRRWRAEGGFIEPIGLYYSKTAVLAYLLEGHVGLTEQRVGEDAGASELMRRARDRTLDALFGVVRQGDAGVDEGEAGDGPAAITVRECGDGE